MSKVFEDVFGELQVDMVSICSEYVQDGAEKIYIYCSYEAGMIAAGYFYQIEKRLVERHEIAEILPGCDASIEMQSQVMEILIEDLCKIYDACKRFGRDMPSEIKLIYDAQENDLSASYKYEPVFSDSNDKTAADIEEEWYEEVKKDLLS